MPELDKSQLEELTNLARALLTPKEICIVLEIDFEAAERHFYDETHPVFKAYQKGILMLKCELNEANIKFAKQSSSHAMNKVLKEVSKLLSDRRKNEQYYTPG